MWHPYLTGLGQGYRAIPASGGDQFIKRPGLGFSLRPAPLYLTQWQTFQSGLNNAITDVPGIKVGQLTYSQDSPAKIRTGVTSIVPDAELLTNGQGNLATTGIRASSVCLNGNGELTGANFMNEFGVLNSPILLTNTRSVGALHDGVNAYFEKYSGPVVLPVAGYRRMLRRLFQQCRSECHSAFCG